MSLSILCFQNRHPALHIMALIMAARRGTLAGRAVPRRAGGLLTFLIVLPSEPARHPQSSQPRAREQPPALANSLAELSSVRSLVSRRSQRGTRVRAPPASSDKPIDKLARRF